MCLIVIGSDRGLCGGYNSSIIDNLQSFAQTMGKDNLSLITIGAIPKRRATKLGFRITDSLPLPSADEHEAFLDALTDRILTGFLKKEFSRVSVLFTQYLSALDKNTTVKEILPISPHDVAVDEKHALHDYDPAFATAIMDPSPTALIDRLLPEVRPVPFQCPCRSHSSANPEQLVNPVD